MSYTRETLSKRHRLSHQQIDRWLDENSSKDFLQEKLGHLKMVKHFIAITDLLLQNEIPFTCLKGPLLSQHIYNDPTVRYSKDIDILIDKNQLDTTVQFFLNNGYDFTEGNFWPKNKVQQGLLIDHHHHLSFFNKEINFCVEVHWILMHNIPISQKKMKIIVADNLTEMSFSGRRFTVLNREFQLLFLLLHGSRHGWERLKWLVDIYEYPIDKIDTTAFNKLVKELNAERIIGQTNFLLHNFFNAELPSSIHQQHNEQFNHFALDFINSKDIIPQVQYKKSHIHLYYYLMFPAFAYRFKILFKILFNPGDIKSIESRFKMIYYINRPYSYLKRQIFNA
ncbi:MAG: hypothetical protein ACI9L6_001196 [Flavobacterium sp.]|jgi:hypothetical protein